MRERRLPRFGQREISHLCSSREFVQVASLWGMTTVSDALANQSQEGNRGMEMLTRDTGAAALAPDGAPVAPPCAMVIFGAAGDLTKRLVVPALYNLVNAGRLPNEFQLIGLDLAPKTTDEWRTGLTHTMQEFVGADGEFAVDHIDQTAWHWLTERMSYLQGDLNDRQTYRRLDAHLAGLDKVAGTAGNRLFYLAIADRFFSVAVDGLGAAGLVTEKDGQWRRVIIEKPFGHDLPSSIELNDEISKVLKERQIYRIDHYLGKETVQNMLVFRFANGIFEPIWNRRYIDHVQITVAETVGVEMRGGYYEKAGALRDMVPNHLCQLIALTAMEPPVSFDANAVRDEKAKILHAVLPLRPEDCEECVVAAQYGPGEMDGKPVPGYRSEPNVAPDSDTDTFAAMKLTVDNWRWAGVPFYIRTGKRLAKRVSEITIQFRSAPFVLFRKTPVEQLKPNLLVVQIQPEEGIWLRFDAKVPGPEVKIGSVQMNFNYKDYFGSQPSTGYETLLYDCMIGDSTLFQRADIVEAGWNIIQPVLEHWQNHPERELPTYPAGSWGPVEADKMMERDGRHWRSTM